MGRRRAITGTKLKQARAWYSIWRAVPTISEMADQLGTSPSTLRNTVFERHRELAFRKKLRQMCAP